MRIYAERPGRAALQLLADVGVLLWVVVVVRSAQAVQASVLMLQAPAQQLTGAGDSIRGAFDDAARTASRVPFVGDDLARALGNGTNAGDSLSASGRNLSTAVEAAGFSIAAAVVLVGVLPVVAVWLTLRVRWVLAARSARLARRAGDDLLALQALTRRSTAKLLRVSPDPAAAWRHGDPATVAALAAVELAALGLHGRREAGLSPSP
jgi:hypothetical protein